MSKQQLKTNKEVKRKRSLQYKREQHQGQRKKHRNECYLPQSRCLPSFLPQFHQTLSLFLFSQQSCCSSKSSKNPTFIRPKSQKPNLPIIRIWSSPEESGDAKKKKRKTCKDGNEIPHFGFRNSKFEFSDSSSFSLCRYFLQQI